MSDVFTLEDLHKAVDDEYGPLEFKAGKETFKLRQILRLPKGERDAVAERLKSLEPAEGEVSEETFDEAEFTATLDFVIMTVVEGGKGARVVEILDGDLLLKKKLFEKWVEKSQAGEASPSSN